jgi:hypothetical protein
MVYAGSAEFISISFSALILALPVSMAVNTTPTEAPIAKIVPPFFFKNRDADFIRFIDFSLQI